jgi:hypothetical protein
MFNPTIKFPSQFTLEPNNVDNQSELIGLQFVPYRHSFQLMPKAWFVSPALSPLCHFLVSHCNLRHMPGDSLELVPVTAGASHFQKFLPNQKTQRTDSKGWC